jgi:hypothetical protein
MILFSARLSTKQAQLAESSFDKTKVCTIISASFCMCVVYFMALSVPQMVGLLENNGLEKIWKGVSMPNYVII